MSGGVYGGDDVGALIFDFGSNSIRTGYAGEDLPKYEIPSQVAILTKELLKKEDKWKFGLNTLTVPTSQKELLPILKDGIVEDWEIMEETLNYIYEQQMQTDPSLHPILMSEPPWNPRAKREKLTELMFEKYNVPAFYLVKSPVLSAFANGKSSGLVIDSGAIHTTVTPVHDGYCLLNGIVRSPLGGDFITLQCKNLFADKKIPVLPHYMVKLKDQDEFLQSLTKSYYNFMLKQVIQDFQASVLQINETPLESNKEVENLPTFAYEFPNRYHRDFGIERFQIPENLFEPSQMLKGPGLTNNSMLSVINCATTSVGMCDIDIRAALYNNLIVVGGNTLIPGYVERLNNELSQKTPSNIRLKMHNSNNSAERRFSAWIGGSILASLGTFQQLWISRQEYDESGKIIIDKKCP